MSGNDDRTQWGQVPNSGGELWASDAGEIATLGPSGGFEGLEQKVGESGEPYITFQAAHLKTRGRRLVATMVLSALGEPRRGGYKVIHADGDPANCALANLAWRRKGDPAVGEGKERRCLGSDCGVMFTSEGPHNRLCPECAKRANASTSNIFEDSESGELPDEPLCGVVGNPHR